MSRDFVTLTFTAQDFPHDTLWGNILADIFTEFEDSVDHIYELWCISCLSFDKKVDLGLRSLVSKLRC